ncbi:MAG: hypothetical protein H0T62_08480 [Parachlamydiaceae bacterium]|nr:hypothetical protein [Parachlamydiaceae bacterium]
MQTSEVSYVRSTDDRYTKIHQNLQIALAVKERDNQLMDFEAFYQSINYEYNHVNDNLGYSESVHFNSKNPSNKFQEYLKSWSNIGEQANLITVIPDLVTTSEKQSLFQTFQNNPLYQGSIGILPYLNNVNLEVGKAFQINIKGLKWEYKIININSKSVSYSVKVTGALSGQGQGVWNIDNGLLGQFKLNLRSNAISWSFQYSSILQ